MKRILIIFLTLNSTLLTLNSYSQWVQQSVPVTSGIFWDMKFVNSNTGFIAHSPNIFLKTTNAGYNWLVNKNWRITSISIVDSQCIYAVGYNDSKSYLYKTSNQGISWDSIYSPIDYYTYLYFYNRDTGVISGGDTFNNFIWYTTNGGQTKQLVATYGGATTGKFFFLKEKVNGEYYGWMYYQGGRQIRSTTNSGVNWTQLPNIPGFNSINGFCFTNKDTGWVSITNNANFVYYTVNGGMNWTNKIMPYNSVIHFDIWFVNQNTGWIGCDMSNKIYKTTNGGTNWGTQFIPGSSSSMLFFLDSINGWAQTSINTIIHTTNGGGTITSIISGSTETQKDYKLYQNYPNPFNSTSNLKFEIVNLGRVKIIVYDVMGREVQTLVNETLKPGTYEVTFDGSRLGGSSSTATGIYFYQLIVDNKIVQTRKMILLK